MTPIHVVEPRQAGSAAAARHVRTAPGISPRLRRLLPSLAGVAVLLAVLPAGAQRVPDTSRPMGVAATPAARKQKLHVGESVAFRVETMGNGPRCTWALDGKPVGEGTQWRFAPALSDLGVRRVTASVRGQAADGGEHAWLVRVEPPRPPQVSQVSPAGDVLTVEAQRPVRLRLRAQPSVPGEEVRVAWMVDGRMAGEGPTFELSPAEAGSVRVRALATSSLGSAVAREWRLNVTPRSTTTTSLATQLVTLEPAHRTAPEPTLPSTPTTQPPAPPIEPSRVEPQPVPSTTMPPERPLPPPPSIPPTPGTMPPAPPATPPEPFGSVPERLASRTPIVTPTPSPPPPAPAGAGAEEVRALLSRYEAAWRAGDVSELRRIGQVTNDKQASALRDYFADTKDLDVAVTVIDIHPDGERTTVRFTRRDSFRDPTGRTVTKESPPIEKEVVRTPDGLRFAPAR